jgi:uncharacterized protein (DUF1501 family)
MKLTRREFLRRLGAVGTLGAMYSLDALISSPLAEAAGEDYRALVCVFLFGGNDGNNTVVPASGEGYTSYSAIRGSLALAGQDLVPLAPATGIAAYGLHPQLAPLKALWDAGSMAVLFNVGTLAQPLTKTTYSGNALKPDGLFSHFDQQTQWQVTGANSLVRSGWGGRIADRLNHVNGSTPVPLVISIAGDNLYVTGDHTSALAIPSTGGFALHGSTNTPTAYARRAAQDQLLALEREFLLIKDAGDVMTRALANSNIIDPVITSEASTVEGLFAGQNGAFAKQLLQVAKLIEARTNLGVKRQIFFVSLEGFDTHGNQLNTQSTLFAQLAPALKTFYDATVQLGVASNVTTFTLSDFGRTLQPNTRGGTDHGWGSHHFIIGGAVRGRQFYGRYPVLALDGPDDAGEEGCWIPTASVDQYAATLATWFGVSASDLPLVVPNIGRFAGANLGFMA